MWRYTLSLVTALILAAGAQAGALEEGVAAYRSRDYVQAFMLLQPLADAGEAEAQFVLGEMYRPGRGFLRSAAEAVPLLRQAAEAGHLGAMNALGEMAEAGEGMRSDAAEARRWFGLAAAAGHAPAQLNLGMHYIRFEETRDFTEAAAWVRRAAAQDLAEAQYLYGRLLLDGRGVTVSEAEALEWIDRAAAQNHVWAQRFAAVLRLPDAADRMLMLRELKRQRAAGTARLSAVASDARYGHDPAHPVKVGLGYEAEWRFLNALRGPAGEVVHYRRLAPCCKFKRDSAPEQGFISRYEVSHAGLTQPIMLYLNMFEDAEPQAPQGFTYAQDEDAP